MRRTSRAKQPPRCQKGCTMIDLVLPAHTTDTDKGKAVRFDVAWEVKATRPKTERDWVRWEVEQARQALERATSALQSGRYARSELSSAMNHAVRVWSLVQLRGKGTNDRDYHEAFVDRAPAALIQLYWRAVSALSWLAYGVITPSDAIETVSSMVQAALGAADRPPKRRRGFPLRRERWTIDP